MLRIVATVLLLLPMAVLTAASAETPPAEGGVFPDIALTVPLDSELQNYLGVTDSGDFRLPQIDTDVVIVEVFSMYCPHCQRQAPLVNRVYEIIEADTRFRGRIKLVGIGAGNSAYEVGIFKKKYGIPFPLFADEDFTIHEKLGEVRTPYFIGFRIRGDGTHEVFYSRLGGFADPQKFLERMIERSGLQ
jgi:peroxiredoxin